MALRARRPHLAEPPAKAPLIKFPKRHHKLLLAITIAAALLLAALIYLALNWPFNRDKFAKDLQDATHSTVQIRSYRKVYFPHPGCIAEGVVLRRGSDPRTPPLATVRRLEVTTNYTGMLHRQVRLMRADGLHVVIASLTQS